MGDPRTIHNTPAVKGSDIRRDWLLYDADGAVLGRLASLVAHRLRGKHKPGFTPHLDTGDFVVIINAEKIRVSGKKRTRQSVLSPFRLSGRFDRTDGKSRAGGTSGATFAKCRARDASQRTSRTGDVWQT